MVKNDSKKDDTFNTPSDEVQAKIDELMGPPAEEAAPTLYGNDSKKIVNAKKEDKLEDPKENSKTTKSKEAKPEELKDNDKNLKKEESRLDIGQKNSPDDGNIDSPETDEAVNEIVHNESDVLLKQQDDKLGEFKIDTKKRKKFTSLIAVWWQNKKARNITLAILLLAFVAVFTIPTTRYATLNLIGVRAGASFSIIDKISGRPVKNAQVTLNNKTVMSAEDGTVNFSNIKLGKSQLNIQKRSFQTISTDVVIGWGSNPFGTPFEVIPTGTTFKFTVTDWIDDQPIGGAEVTDSESVALADDQGLASLTIEPTDNDLEIIISAEGYRSESITIPATSTDSQKVQLTTAKPDVFISKRSGKYDLYKRDIDGKNETLVLPATGNETNSTYVLGHPDDYKTAALVSSREGKRNDDGYLMDDLYIVDISNKSAMKIEATQSERIRIIDWAGDEIIYVKTVAGPSASNGYRQRIISYNYKNRQQKELGSADYFTDVRLIEANIYYVANGGTNGTQAFGLGRIGLDGTNRKNLIGERIWGVYRTDINEMVVYTEGTRWYSFNITETKITHLEGAPAGIQDAKLFINKSGDKLARVEKRDGKTELLVKDIKTGEESLVLRQSGISMPIDWANDKTILFGIVTEEETARYVVSLTNNEAIKVGDNTASIYDGVLYY